MFCGRSFERGAGLQIVFLLACGLFGNGSSLLANSFPFNAIPDQYTFAIFSTPMLSSFDPITHLYM
jgi:hypothetical protein